MAPPRRPSRALLQRRLVAAEATVARLRRYLAAARASGPPEYADALERDLEAEQINARRLYERLRPEEYRARLRALTADQFRRYLGLVDEHGHAGALVVVEGEGSDG